MRRELLEAVVDTLVPGDDGTPPLPSGTAAGVPARLAPRITAHHAVLDAIARAAGGEEGFIRADPSTRAAGVRDVEGAMPDAFAALLLAVVEEYYDADPVIVAMGWRLEPPQPNGHPLAELEDRLLERVRSRGPIWRDGEPHSPSTRTRPSSTTSRDPRSSGT